MTILRKSKLLFGSILLFSLLGCGETTSESTNIDKDNNEIVTTNNETEVTPELKQGKPMELSGTVVFKPMEGGFFAIDGDDGKNYLPLNLPEHARKGGIKVSMSVEIKQGVVTIYNYGIPIEIKELIITDDSADEGTVM